MSKRSKRQPALLLVLALNLTACAPSSPVVAKPAQIPPPAPELMVEPDSSKSYSDSVRQLLFQWRQKLTDWKRGS